MTIRADYNITDKQKISARYNYDWGIQATGPSFISPVFNSQSDQPSHQGQLTYTYAISPTLVNNFIGSGSWYTAIFGVADFAKTTAADARKHQRQRWRMDQRRRRFPQLAAMWARRSWWTTSPGSTAGTRLKGGINYRFDKITDTSIASSSYKGSYSFADLTDFTTGQINATGLGDTFSQSFPDIFAAHIRMSSLGAYVQDEWKVRSNLTLTLGFRIEHDGNPACLDNCFARMNTQFGTAGYVGGANVPYDQTITTGLHNEYKSMESVIPEPRFGFAWKLNAKTVLRGGIGMFATLPAGSTASSVFGNAPSKFSPSVHFGEVGLQSDQNSSAYAALAAYNIFTSGFGGRRQPDSNPERVGENCLQRRRDTTPHPTTSYRRRPPSGASNWSGLSMRTTCWPPPIPAITATINRSPTVGRTPSFANLLLRYDRQRRE